MNPRILESLWAHNDINSHGLFTSEGMVGFADGLDFRVGDEVHGYVGGEVRQSDGLEPSDIWVVGDDRYFECGEIVNLAEAGWFVRMEIVRLRKVMWLSFLTTEWFVRREVVRLSEVTWWSMPMTKWFVRTEVVRLCRVMWLSFPTTEWFVRAESVRLSEVTWWSMPTTWWFVRTEVVRLEKAG